MMGTKLKFSSAYHPQTDDQTEMVSRSLGDLLRCFVSDHNRNWIWFFLRLSLPIIVMSIGQ